VRKEAKYLAISYVYRTLYLLSLTALIPAVVINAAPTELKFFSATPFTILVVALTILIISIIGMFRLHKTKSEAFIALAWTTGLPGVIALSVSLGARSVISSIVTRIVFDLSRIDPLIDLYIEQAVPQVWFLTMGYVAIAGLWYLMAKAVR